MATRRSRIKGIANIPQRRKVETKPNEDCNDEVEKLDLKDTEVNVSTDNTIQVKDNSNEIQEQHDIATTENGNQEEISNETIVAATVNGLQRRRNTIKPLVNKKLLLKPKAKNQNVHEDKPEEDVNPIQVLEKDIAHKSVEISLPAESLTQNENVGNDKLPVADSRDKSPQPELIISGQATRYSQPPLSPVKIKNRTRIKPVPKLGQRQTGAAVYGSASESEDESKRNYKRIRTESACSTTSVTNEPQADTVPVPKPNEIVNATRKKPRKRMQHFRKIAEARRNFMEKFQKQIPDKHKLTMMDLIYYNPVTNPMSQKPKKVINEQLENESPSPEPNTKPPEKNESDEENTIPAPQIKIAANGEIVIDEKSLLIENEETKRNREEIQKSDLIDGDFDTGYGIFKRQKRTKDWSKEETIKFYKALNTLGTDFTLMLELFKGRTRRELKLKFKKEERIHGSLINKALTQPMEFDITDLRNETENERLIKQTTKEIRAEAKVIGIKPHMIKKTQKTAKERFIKQRPQRKCDEHSLIKEGASSAPQLEEEDEGVEMSNEVIELRPTRSGRIPKLTKLYSQETFPVKKAKKTSDSDVLQSSLEGVSTLEPGSIMILASQTPTGEPTFQVFMVTPSQEKVPITLEPDLLSNITQTASPENTYEIQENAVRDGDVTNPLDQDSLKHEIVESDVKNSNVENTILPENKNELINEAS